MAINDSVIEHFSKRLEELTKNRSILQANLSELQSKQQELIANINAFNGAIEECENTLKHFGVLTLDDIKDITGADSVELN